MTATTVADPDRAEAVPEQSSPALAVEARGLVHHYRKQLALDGPDLPVPEGPRVREAFEARHERRFGWRLDDSEIELVGLRARAIVRADRRAVKGGRRRPAPGKARVGERRVWFGRAHTAARIDRSGLAPGHVLEGPAIVEEYSGTTLVPPGWRAEVLAGGHLWLTVPDRASRPAAAVPRSGM